MEAFYENDITFAKATLHKLMVDKSYCNGETYQNVVEFLPILTNIFLKSR